MSVGASGIRSRVLGSSSAMIAMAASWCLLAPAPASAMASKRPDLVRADAYLVAPARLIDGHYYVVLPGVADFGLTIDGALALAAAGGENPALRRIMAFLDTAAKDKSGKTINDWTGIGTRFASGGDIGKEALLAEVVGDNPRSFGGHDLIAALDALVCSDASTGADHRCSAAGSYADATSVFDQALGVIAQLRAGQARQAAAPIAYLESLQSASGSFPSLLPAGGGQDVDSTALAVMALALVPGSTATAGVTSALAWIASKQEEGGGFPGAGGESVNSTALAIQALTIRASRYRPAITAARGFLAGEQNADGGFNADASGQRGSDLRASAQAVGGAVGTPFGALRRDLSHQVAAPGRGTHLAADLGLAGLAVAMAGGSVALLLLRRRRLGRPAVGREQVEVTHRAGS